MIKRVEAREELQQIFGENYTVSDKIEAILARVSEGGALKFSELFAEMASRIEIVVTFLALLELIRLKQVRAFQPGQFGEIEIAAAA
jgi:segregation and condensation protein A